MADNERSVFERLDDIESSQSTALAQNEKIIELLNNLNNQRIVNKASVEKQKQNVNQQQVLRQFLKDSQKEYIWFGPLNEFYKSKSIMIVVSISLMIIGLLSTVFTTIACGFYSTFTLFENIWFIFACIMLLHSIYVKKRMIDVDLKNHVNTKFIQDKDGTWRNTNQEKKAYKIFRIIAYISVFANIVLIWIRSDGAIAVGATIFELLFVGLSLGLMFAYVDLFCMYNSFILYTGKNYSNGNYITLIFDVYGKKLATYEEYKEKMKDYL